MSILRVSTLSIEYEIMGSCDPVVVLLNGLQLSMSSWERLTPHLNNLGTILLYNRLGVGASDPPSELQDGVTIASQLNGILSELTLKTPVILVGHSIGGLYANLYARLYPENVGSVVFLEATHPDEPAYREANSGFFWRTLEKILNLKRNPIQEDPNSEYNSISTAVRQVSAAPSFPNMPLLVISGSKNLPFVPRKAFEHHRRMQDELANLVPQATHLKAEKSSHFPQLSEPEYVADAIVTFVRSIDR